MKGNGWIITDSKLEGGWIGTNIDKHKYPIRFRLKDDDGEVYFLGRMTQKLYDKGTEDALFAPLDTYGVHYGCTSIEIYENGKWEVI